MTTTFDSQPPALSPEQLASLASTLFGVDGEIKTLVSERDQNAQLKLADKTTRVLKIANASENIALLELQNAAMTHINAVDPMLGVPEVFESLAGKPIETWVDQVSGDKHAVRLLSFIPGELLANSPKTLPVLRNLGEFLGRLSHALQGFAHPAAHREHFLWNLDNALAIESYTDAIKDDDNRHMIRSVYQRYREHTLPKLASLRMAVIHSDINDNNVSVDGEQINGAFDFGDMVCARQINELAITMAYALMGVRDIAAASRALIGGYIQHFTLQESELTVLFDLIEMRLAMSVSISSYRANQFPDNDYLLISQRPAVALLSTLKAMNSALKICIARTAAGFPAVAHSHRIVSWLNQSRQRLQPIFENHLHTRPRLLISLADGAPGSDLANDADQYTQWLNAELKKHAAEFAIGLYGEDRSCYKGDQFTVKGSSQSRSTHLGIDIFIEAGTVIHAPLAGKVYSLRSIDAAYDYGTLLVLEHQTDQGQAFYTLYGHLATRTAALFNEGDEVAAGNIIGFIGDQKENGLWSPHLHFQLITTMLGLRDNFDGATELDRMDIWSQICPDPSVFFEFPAEAFSADQVETQQLQQRRENLLGPSLSLSYKNKLHIVRGEGCWLYDNSGRAYLDCVNNISHVGHCHPHVVNALEQQARTLNTNTRYLHQNILDYAERLAATFPDPLCVVYFVNSGSEANELALRLARTYTARQEIISLDWGYHGNTGGLIDISPYKFARKGGNGAGTYTHIAELPDPYRGRLRGDTDDTARGYATSIDHCIAKTIEKNGAGPAAFIAESISGCGGQIVFPKNYLKYAFEKVRAAGGVCIADEVQTGFGRVGTAMWAFELQNATPDIVTLGKPIGNGHPMAAVITTKAIADSFNNGMEFFNSFGGNPVSCAVGMAVLDVIEDEKLLANAINMYQQLTTHLQDMQSRYSLIGDIRGHGLFLGIELVRNHQTLEPATEEASQIINYLRENGVLLSTDGPFDNVLKFKPPMVFAEPELSFFVEQLEAAFASLT